MLIILLKDNVLRKLKLRFDLVYQKFYNIFLFFEQIVKANGRLKDVLSHLASETRRNNLQELIEFFLIV